MIMPAWTCWLPGLSFGAELRKYWCAVLGSCWLLVKLWSRMQSLGEAEILRVDRICTETEMPEVPWQHVKAATPLASPVLCRMRHFSLRHITMCRSTRSSVQYQGPWAVEMKDAAQKITGRMVKGGAQAGTGEPHSSRQLTDCQLKKCRSGADKTGFSGNRENKISI